MHGSENAKAMLSEGSEPAIPAIVRLQTYTLG
jgi:hypothetical protein